VPALSLQESPDGSAGVHLLACTAETIVFEDGDGDALSPQLVLHARWLGAPC